MTYVVGISHRGVNSILADQRVTKCTSDGLVGDNHGVKIGQLFTGCIFGATGNVTAYTDFLLSAKYQCGTTDSHRKNWEKFLEFADNYSPPTSKIEQFQLLLSSSDGTSPQWYLYDSTNGISEIEASVLTLGSGKDSLDAYIEQYFDLYVHKMDEICNQPRYSTFRQEVPSYLFAYYFTQLSSMIYRPTVEQMGVGGVFTFVSQTSTLEFFQKPSLYLFALQNKATKEISVWSHHIWFEDNWLVVLSGKPPSHVKPSEELIELSCFSNDLMQPASPDGIWDVQLLASKIKSKLFGSDYLIPQPYFQIIGHCDPVTRPQAVFSLGYGVPPIINDKGQTLNQTLALLGMDL